MTAGKGLAGSLLFDRRGQIEPLVRSLCIKDSAEDRNYKEGDGRNNDGAQKKRIAPGKEKEKQNGTVENPLSYRRNVMRYCYSVAEFGRRSVNKGKPITGVSRFFSW